MLEQEECYKLGDYSVPDEFKLMLLEINAKEYPFHSDYLGITTKAMPFFDHFQKIENRKYGIPVHSRSVYNTSIDIINNIMPQYTLVRGNVMFLMPGAQIKHQDPRVFHRLCKRVHIPIVTNAKSAMCIDVNEYHMPENTVWTFDNITKLHWSKNGGDSIRIHLLLDVILIDRLAFISKHIDILEIYQSWETWEQRNNKELMKLLDLEKEDAIPFIPLVDTHTS